MEKLEADNNKYFKPLTGVRAIAAFMVYIHHFNPFPTSNYGKQLFDFTQELHVGVTLFFVLSGFLIAYRYSDLNNFSIRSYMINRIARIYPIYFILTTITFIVYGINNQVTLNYKEVFIYLLNITFLKGFFEDFKFSGIAQGWSLTVEEIFYISAPIFFVFLKRSRAYFILLPILIMSVGIGLVLIFSRLSFFGFFSSFEFMFNYTFFGRCFEFFIGIALAIIYKNNLLKTKFNYFTYIGIIGIIISILSISLFKGDYDYGIRHPFGKLINTLILPLIGISMFYYGLLKERTFISDMLSSKCFILLGKSSYIFYLIHTGVIEKTLHKYVWRGGEFMIIIIISIFLFKFLEEPLNNYIRNKFTGT